MKHPSAAALLLLAALLAAAPALNAAGDHGNKSKGDGYARPLSQNKNYKLYKFTVTMKQSVTSFRPAPLPFDQENLDPNQPGSIASLASEIFDSDGNQIGIGAWNRLVIANDPIDPEAPDGDRIATRLLTTLFEFGKADDGYSDSLSVTVTTKWLLSPDRDSSFTDYDGVISGGKGKFMAAGGDMSVSNVVIEDGLLKEAFFTFRVYVPNGLPKA